MSSSTVTQAPLAIVDGLTVSHRAGDARIDALSDIHLKIAPGDALALWGRSGSGKTTLLHALGGLVSPTAGSISWRGEKLSSLDAAARGRARAHGIAYVFQGANLLPHFTAWENVAFALEASSGALRKGEAPGELLALVGLEHKLDSLPAELSGGEAQRVAVARALAQSPDLLLCDEPTGHLDSDTGTRVLDMIGRLQDERGFALVVATHDPDVAARYDRMVELLDGRIVTEESGS